MNESGIYPVEFKILVRYDEVSETTEGGLIIKPDDVKEKEQFAEMEGELIAVGHKAFTDWPKEGRPQVGARIITDRYVGSEVQGKDGVKYRVMTDKEILAVRE
jgi:co-chaperonin GroES (HSP10)